MPNSMGYNPPQLNQESSAKLPSASIASTVPERNDPGNSTIISSNQTLDRHGLTLHQHHQLNLQYDRDHQQLQPQQQLGHPDGIPDVDPAPASVTSPSSSKTVPSPSSQPTLQPTTSVSTNGTSIQYRECLKNHAASMGGHVLDGCGEFMPSGDEGTPEALKCAACDCHRNFHRKEIEGEQQQTGTNYYPNYHVTRANNIPHHATKHHHPSPPISTMPPQHQRQQQHKHTPMMMAFGGNSGAPAESSSEGLNMYQTHTGPYAVLQPSYSMSKKRFRTKFTQQQKDKMHEFAEKLEWRIQKQDEQEVQQFCDELGVKRQVFKVWMHNNKQAMKKKQM